jgi:hypothetical protein
MTHAVSAHADQTPSTSVKTNWFTRITGWVLKKEPVAVAWSVSMVGEILVGHHIVGAASWTSLTNVILPVATTAGAALLRDTVFSPKSAAALQATADSWQAKAEAVGILSEADFGRLTQWMNQHLPALLQAHATAASTSTPIATVVTPVPAASLLEAAHAVFGTTPSGSLDLTPLPPLPSPAVTTLATPATATITPPLS